MRIAHFSDIHAGGWLRHWRGYFDKRLIGACNYVLNRRRTHQWSRVARAVECILALRPDVVICTGDLASIAEPAEFDQAEAALAPLLTADCEFLCVPGNHDAYVAHPRCQDACDRVFARLSGERWQLADLPLARTVGGCRFLLVNEARPAPPFAASGALSPAAAQWLENELATAGSSSSSRVLVGHYPLFDAAGGELPRKRRCSGAEVAQQALTDGRLQLALCGHIHTPFVRPAAGGGLEVCAGSLTATGRFAMLTVNDSGAITHEWVDVDG
jgi:3',5'-cyclic AMP phosphodiesterase CpdA